MFSISKKIILSLLFAGIFSVFSCITTPVCITSSNTPLHNKKITENLGKVEGASDFFSLGGSSILGLWMIGKPDIQQAIDKALEKKGGDALINIKCYSSYYWLLLWGFSTVTVQGEAVRFEK